MSVQTVASLVGVAGVESKPIGLVAGPGGHLRRPGVKLPRRLVQKPVLKKVSPYEASSDCEGEVDERFRAIAFELQPKTVIGTYFARRMAVGMVRADRGVTHEEAMLAFRRRHAGEAFDRARLEAAQGLLRRLDGNDPRAARAARVEMLRMPEGVDLLIERLVILRANVAREEPSWDLGQQEGLRDACGWLDEEVTPTRGWTLARALMGDGRLLSAEDRAAALAAPRFSAWVGFALAGELAQEIDRLEAHRSTLDHETIEWDRLEAAERAVFDPGIAATRARAHEAQAAKEVRQSFDALIAVEAAAEAATLAPEAGEAAAVDACPTSESDPERIEESASIAANSGYFIDVTAILGSFGAGTSRVRPVVAAGRTPVGRGLEPGLN